MRYVTIKMLCKHAKKSPKGMIQALKRGGVVLKKEPGDARGYRLSGREANKFLERQWPSVGPLPLPSLASNDDTKGAQQ